MARDIMNAFETADVARKVVNELVTAGCRKEDIFVLEGDENEVVGQAVDHGFDEEQVRAHADAIRGGKKLVVAIAPDDAADDAVAVMNSYEDAGRGEAPAAERKGTVREVEEELSVGKRKVGAGGARVKTAVTESEAEETVRLADEKVEVVHEDKDRELSPEEANAAFADKTTLEMLETTEEAEVEKKARLVGEVSLVKNVEERKETVRGTVRRADAEVEKLGRQTDKR